MYLLTCIHLIAINKSKQRLFQTFCRTAIVKQTYGTSQMTVKETLSNTFVMHHANINIKHKFYHLDFLLFQTNKFITSWSKR